MAAIDDVHWRIIGATAAVIVGLELERIEDHVYAQLVPDDTSGYNFAADRVTDVSYPFVGLTVEDEQESKVGGSTETEEWQYPLRVWICDKLHHHDHDKMRVYMVARKRIIRALSERYLPGVNEVRNILVTPHLIIDPRLPNYQHVVSGIGVKFWTFEARA